MRTPELKEFIRQNSHLIWYIPEDKKEDISDDALVETILNYGTFFAVKELFKILSIEKVAEIYKL